ncbi:MAG: hypothetical protein FJ109_19740 [Deltaproteobacteria bacterium]|nr:hypothetical protein [Deltaproteobacteria bacterium]
MADTTVPGTPESSAGGRGSSGVRMRQLPSLPAVSAALAIATLWGACSGGLTVSLDVGGDALCTGAGCTGDAKCTGVSNCTADAPAGDSGADGSDATGAGFAVEILTFKLDAPLEGIAVGAFEPPAVEYGRFSVEPRFKHLVNFLMTPFCPPCRVALPTNGPIVLIADDLETLVFSPMDHFFVSYVSFEDDAIRYGVAGEVDVLPAGFEHRFIAVRGQGVNATVREWGRRMLEDRGKLRVDRYADTGLSRLGYWTDNGAWYYYKTEPGMNEEETLLAVKAEADKVGIPYGYFQIDSWWYFKDGEAGLWPPAGLVLWEPQPEKFPSGLSAFHEKLGLPLVAHNRWFAVKNAYLEDFPFVVEETMSLPTSGGVFEKFMSDAKSWGVETYEQDWLINQVQGLKYLRNHVEHASTWMQQLDDAALGEGLTTQLCMPGAAHVMDSIDRKAATTTRTSTDYHLDVSKESYWPQFHTVNMIASALGLLPFKDNFQSSEKHGEAEALISALSAGMVGIGDGLGMARKDIIMRTCREDGVLLKPDRPATPIDKMFLPHERPYTTFTESATPGLGRTVYLAAYLLERENPERSLQDRAWAIMMYDGRDIGELFVFPDEVTDWQVDLPAELEIHGPVVAFDWRTRSVELVEGALSLPPLDHLYDFRYLVLAPVQSNGLALIGDVDRYVTMADRRIAGAEVLPDAIRASLIGNPGEAVALWAFDAIAGKMLVPVEATVGADGTAVIEVGR